MTPQAAARDVLCDAYQWAADILLTYHTNPWELDEAMQAAGFTLGPCLRQDAEGLEHAYRRRAPRRGAADVIQVPSVDRAYEEGRQGRAAGWGWYRYPGGGGPVEDPLVEDLLLEEAWLRKITRTELSDDDLVERMAAALANAALECLGQGMIAPKDLAHLLEAELHYTGPSLFKDGPDNLRARLSRLSGPLRSPWDVSEEFEQGWARL